ncbi:kinase-like protein [Hymenopellis radicata]|nr:kinase-like protein [Hymenopellis radicata]
MSDETNGPKFLKWLRRQTCADVISLQRAASLYQEDVKTEVDPDLAYLHHLDFEKHRMRLTDFAKQSNGLFSRLRTNPAHICRGLLKDVSTAHELFRAKSAARAEERKEFVALQQRPRKELIRKCYWEYFPSARIFPTLSLDEGRYKFEVEVGIPLDCSPFNTRDSDMTRTYANKKLFFASSRSDGGDAQVTVLKRIKLPSDLVSRAIARKEVETLKLMSKEGCPCLLQYIASGTVESSNPGEPAYLCLVTDYIEGCSLLRWIQAQRQSLGEETVKCIIKQALVALHFIHSRGLIHRGISPKSILLDIYHNIKIINLDVYTPDDDVVQERRRSLLTHTATITEDYADLTSELRDAIQHGCHFWSPEFIARGEISCSADIWALGCTALYVSTGPWSFTQGLEMFNYQRGSGQEPSAITQVSDKRLQETFLRPAMRSNPTTRPTAEDLCRRRELGILVPNQFSDSSSTLLAGPDGL